MSGYCKWLSIIDVGYGPYEEHFHYCTLEREKDPICEGCALRDPEHEEPIDE
jgi:hypothetical protein